MRNRSLAPEARQRAAALPRVLSAAVAARRSGGIAADVLSYAGALAEAGFAVDYFALRDAATLAPPRGQGATLRLLAAVQLGAVRLVDTLPI